MIDNTKLVQDMIFCIEERIISLKRCVADGRSYDAMTDLEGIVKKLEVMRYHLFHINHRSGERG